jgi:hypothetical protein
MANTIKIKRRPASGAAGKPSSLLNGELAFNENDNILYYGLGSGVAGAATSIEQIGGSGYFAHRGGINASGVWPIGITGNSATVTNGVYTTGNQTINGSKTFGDRSVFPSGMRVGDGSSQVSVNLLANDGGINGPYNVYFDTDADGPLNVAYKQSTTHVGTTAISLNRASSSQTLTGVSIDGNASTVTSGVYTGRTLTAGSGLVGGGDLSSDKTFNVGQGDGISVTDNAIAVDSSVVRTTGNQSISGVKTFLDTVSFNDYITVVSSGATSANVISFNDTATPNGPSLGSVSNGTRLILTKNDSFGHNAIGVQYGGGERNGTWFSVPSGMAFSFYDGSQEISNINSTQFSYGPNSNFTISIAGNVTNGSWSGNAIAVNKGGTGRTSYSNGQLLIGSGTGLAANTLTAGSNVQITNGSGTITIAATGFVLSSRTLTAGSGLVGGGDLSSDRTFDINTGDGIQIVSDAVAVDSTVVRTTGTQTIAGVKTLSNRPVLNSGLSVLMTSTASSGLFFPVFTSDPSSAAQALAHRTPSQVKSDIGLANVTNDAQIKKLASTSGGFVPTWNGTTGDALNIGYSVETTLTGGTSAIPRADAVKTYVDNMVVSGIATNDAMIFKGAIDCSTNPNYPAADRGWVYKISVAGRIGGASGPVVEVNDTIICGTDGTAAGTHAAVGSNWNILQTNIVDASILVTGPASATSGNFAMFDGATGKIVRDAGFSSGVFATSSHVHGNITNDGKIGSTSGLPLITTAGGSVTTGSFGILANTFCVGNDSRLSDTRNTTNSITVNNGGAGDSSSFTFNGSAARTISYNSIGAPSTFGTNASGTWNISITGNAGFVTSGIYTYGSYADPSWITSLAKSKVGLSNVENTALSTWTGSTNLAILGTVATGTWSATTIAVDKGGTGQTSYTNGQLLIGNTTGNTLSKATLTSGTAIAITNGAGSITIGHGITSSLSGPQGSGGIASITVDALGHVTAVTSATYLTAGTVCAAIVDCTLDGGSF